MLTPHTRTIETLCGRYDPGTDTGYMGYVSSSDFITGSELIDLLDFRDGVDQNSDAGWLKFYVGPRAVCNQFDHERILLIAKKSLKYSVSWEQINRAGLVYGTMREIIKEQQYTLRCITGGVTKTGSGSEWDELFCRVHVPHSTSNRFSWESFDTKTDTMIADGNGAFSWCQEVVGVDKTRCIYRGTKDTSFWNACPVSFSTPYYGWRPVLELVE